MKSNSEARAVLANASETCDDVGSLDDDDQTLVLDGEGEDVGSGDVSFRDINCVLDELEVPRRVLEKMSSTRAMDGRMSDDWDRIEAEWSYHPDSGMDLVLSITDD